VKRGIDKRKSVKKGEGNKRGKGPGKEKTG